MKSTKKNDVLQAILIAGFLYLLFFIVSPFLQNL